MDLRTLMLPKSSNLGIWGARMVKCTEKCSGILETLDFGQMPKNSRKVLFELEVFSMVPIY